jgi:adenine-specific DNA methylase
MDLLYLDPPYNNRQYSDYYFMLNQIAMHHTIPDLEDFFENIEYQRGQNMSTSTKSALSSEASFLDTLGSIIENANCEWVVISYNNGKNHWGNFMDGTSDEGKRKIVDWIESKEYLDSSTISIKEHPRTNYQSRGEEAMRTLEYLISVRKQQET